MTDTTTTLQDALLSLAQKMKQVFEQQANKVNTFTGNVSDDTKYPSAKLVKDSLDLKEDAANRVSTFSGTVADHSKYPSAKLVKDALDDKLESSDLPTKTSDLTNDGSDGEHPFISSLSPAEVTVAKQSSADSGYAATYIVKQNNVQVGSKIQIPKDFLVKSGTVETVDTADSPVTGYEIGDKYIDFVVNTKENDGTAEHFYINVKDLVEDTTYDADNSTIVLTQGVFSVKSAGIDTAQIKDSAVTTAKINNGAVTSAKIDSTVVASWLDTDDVDTRIEEAIEYLDTALGS